VDPEENEVLLRLGLHRLPAKEFPRLRALAPALAEYDGARELDQGLTILLSGLETQLSRQVAGSSA
jgi:threonine/homoserine efflux transporter RhtA